MIFSQIPFAISSRSLWISSSVHHAIFLVQAKMLRTQPNFHKKFERNDIKHFKINSLKFNSSSKTCSTTLGFVLNKSSVCYVKSNYRIEKKTSEFQSKFHFLKEFFGEFSKISSKIFGRSKHKYFRNSLKICNSDFFLTLFFNSAQLCFLQIFEDLPGFWRYFFQAFRHKTD